MKLFVSFLVSVLLTLTSSAQKIQHIEPPFWWEEMSNTKLQIMFHGEKIGLCSVHVNGLLLEGVVKTENPNYIFVNIDTKDVRRGKYEFQFKNNGKTILKVDYELKERRPNSKYRKGFDSKDMVYLIMPDRFSNGDESNDSHSSVFEKINREFHGGRHGGDIQGIINHLDYIKELGATAIWSTPLLEDNDSTFSYHTYGQSDVYKIDPRYGTNEDYKRLANEMHQRDMKLIMDYVTNHWGAAHWMMKDLPTYSWIHQFPGYAQSNYRMSTQMDPNVAEIDKKYCVNGWFVKSMPDLNQSNELVLNYLTQNAIWWVEYADLDGLRVDTYSYNDKDGIAKWTKLIMDEYPNFNIVGEVWLHDQAQISYWQKDSKISAIQSYNTYLPSVMDFTLHDALSSVFREVNPSWDNGMIKVYENFVNDFLYPNINNIMVFAENHDTHRFNHLFQDFRDYKLAMTLLATVRGIPQLYYGSEIGMAGNKDFGDGAIRQDFPGGWKNDSVNAFLKENRTEEQQLYFEFTKKIFNWRKSADVIHIGKTKQYLPLENVYVFFRYTDEKAVMVVINNSDVSQKIDFNRFEESIKKYKKGKDVLSDSEIDFSQKEFQLSPKTSYVFELN
jgi:neopullulanase